MSDKLASARLKVNKDRPYYASVLWALQPVPTKDFAKMAAGPMGVDQYMRLYFDPEVIDQYSVDRLSAILVHEIGHVIRAHAKRCGGRNAVGINATGGQVSIWNVAGDLEINDDIAEEGLPLGEEACYPKNFKDKHGKRFPDNLMAEEYYEMLMEEMKQRPGVSGGVAGGQCGSVSDGQGKDGDVPPDGTEKVPSGVGEAEQELIRQKVAQDVEAHAKAKGNVPSWLQRWANERLKAKVDWRKMLASFVRRAVGEVRGAVDYSYQRPGRRSGSLPDFIWPVLRQPEPRVHIQIDTSGSMSDKELAQGLAEVEGVLTGLGMRTGITVSAVDAAVHTTQKVFKAHEVKLMGGGGTDMTLGLHAAEKMKPKPHVIILITDCETNWPERPLSVPLIVARTSARAPAPPWAKIVDIVPDGK